jgi:ribosomal protein L37AE/L43A
MSTKPAGHPCPNCGEPFCAEFAQLGQSPKWKCNSCGAGGDLAGSLSFTTKQEDKPAPKQHTAPRGIYRVRA